MQILDSLIKGALAQPKKADAKEIIYQLVKYLDTGEEPEMNSAAVRSYFLTTMPVLRRSRARIEAGKKSGVARTNKTTNKSMNKTVNKPTNKIEATEGTNQQTNRNRNRNKERTLRDLGESINQDSPKSCPSSSENVPKNVPQYEHIIRFLNHCSGHTYKTTTKKTRDLIKARSNEGFTFDDFVSVIQFKCNQWKYIPKMSGYMRPETLFGTKFESYLQESKAVHHGAFDEYDNRR